MGSNRRKDHYVQQEYLKGFRSLNSENKICCYDTLTAKGLSNQSTLNYAHENGFLNINIEECVRLLEQEHVKFFSSAEKEHLLNFFSNPRFMDELISDGVELWFKEINGIIQRYGARYLLQNYNNDLCLDEEKKKNISWYIAYQYLRTKSFRTTIMNKVLSDPLVKETFNSYSTDLQKTLSVLIHIKTLVANQQISKMAEIICKCIWIVGVSKRRDIITSDAPVIVIRDPETYSTHFFAGIEAITYPLTPNMILTLINPNNSEYKKLDGYYVELKAQAINYYNKQQVLLCERWIFGPELPSLEKAALCTGNLKGTKAKQDINRLLLKL